MGQHACSSACVPTKEDKTCFAQVHSCRTCSQETFRCSEEQQLDEQAPAIASVSNAELSDSVESEGEGYDQNHCFAFAFELDDQEGEALRQQFDSLPKPEVVHHLLNRARGMRNCPDECWGPPTRSVLNGKKPLRMNPGANVVDQDAVMPQVLRQWHTSGLQALAGGKVAVVFLAWRSEGGATGAGALSAAYDLGLPSGKPLVQIYIERIRRLKHLVSSRTVRKATLQAFMACHIPVYFLCSAGTRETLETFVRKNDCFGLPEEDVHFFMLGEMAVLDVHGRYLLEEQGHILTSGMGDGGVFEAMGKTGVLADMKSRLVECLIISGMENLLQKVADPFLLGFGMRYHLPTVIKCIRRNSPRRGPLFASYTPPGAKKPIPCIATTAEIGEALVQAMDSSTDCRFAYEAASLGQVYVDLVMAEHASVELRQGKVAHLRPEPSRECMCVKTGTYTEQDAFYLELFVEDVASLKASACALVATSEREGWISAVSGLHSARQACVILAQVHYQWLVASGAIFQDNATVNDCHDPLCEVSPLVSYAGENLRWSCPRELTLPFYLPAKGERARTRCPKLNGGASESTESSDEDAESALGADPTDVRPQGAVLPALVSVHGGSRSSGGSSGNSDSDTMREASVRDPGSVRTGSARSAPQSSRIGSARQASKYSTQTSGSAVQSSRIGSARTLSKHSNFCSSATSSSARWAHPDKVMRKAQAHRRRRRKSTAQSSSPNESELGSMSGEHSEDLESSTPSEPDPEFFGELASSTEALPAADSASAKVTVSIDKKGNLTEEARQALEEREAQLALEAEEEFNGAEEGSEVQGSGLFLDDSDSDTKKKIAKERKALRYFGTDSQKKRLDRTLFAKSGDKHPINVQARATRYRRAKVQKVEYCDAGLQGGPWKPTKRELTRQHRIQNMYLHYDAKRVIAKAWNLEDQGIVVNEGYPNGADRIARSQSRRMTNKSLGQSEGFRSGVRHSTASSTLQRGRTRESTLASFHLTFDHIM